MVWIKKSQQAFLRSLSNVFGVAFLVTGGAALVQLGILVIDNVAAHEFAGLLFVLFGITLIGGILDRN